MFNDLQEPKKKPPKDVLLLGELEPSDPVERMQWRIAVEREVLDYCDLRQYTDACPQPGVSKLWKLWRKLWPNQSPPPWPDRIATLDDAQAALDVLVGALEKRFPTPTPCSRVATGARKGKRIEEKMIAKALREPDAQTWTARLWAEALDCSPSTIVETETWHRFEALREAAKQARRRD